MKKIKVGNVYKINGTDYVIDYVFRDTKYDNQIVEVIIITSNNGVLTTLNILSIDGVEYSVILQTFMDGRTFKPYISENMMEFALKIIKKIKSDNKRLPKKGGK